MHKKFWIRRITIITASLFYIASVLVNVLDYGITRKYTDILNDKTITDEFQNMKLSSPGILAALLAANW